LSWTSSRSETGLSELLAMMCRSGAKGRGAGGIGGGNEVEEFSILVSKSCEDAVNSLAAGRGGRSLLPEEELSRWYSTGGAAASEKYVSIEQPDSVLPVGKKVGFVMSDTTDDSVMLVSSSKSSWMEASTNRSSERKLALISSTSLAASLLCFENLRTGTVGLKS